MTATACHYAIVRFLPYVETGEFANVGVVLFAPAARRFCYRVLVRRVGRITAFFNDLETAVVRAALRTMDDEFFRVASMFKSAGTDRRLKSLDIDACMALWNELIRPRESMIRFGSGRVVMASDPEQKLRELFDFYVERNFVTKEYQEQALERAVRRMLFSVDLGNKFTPQVVGNDDYHARFPFVELGLDGPVRAIKPLNLAQDDAAKIIDHGGQWVVRVKALRNRSLLPRQVLFAVDSGDSAECATSQARAREEVIGELRELNVTVAAVQDREAILAFAGA